MRQLVISATILTCVCASVAQKDVKTQMKDVQICAPKVISNRSRGKPGDIHFRRGEKYKHSPVIAYQVVDSGEITHAVVKRSSEVASIDKYALNSITELKYNK